MTQLTTKMAVLICAGSACALGSAAFGQTDEEVENRGTYYEDDAWYDVTEWFDGNDYNPTDEAWWRWDDNTYDRWQDSSGDQDTDRWYGYDSDSGDNADDDWFYDYYDDAGLVYSDADDNGMYEYSYWYWDNDDDGAYDGYYWRYDTNGDGLYDQTRYYSFDARDADGPPTKTNKNRNDNNSRKDRQDAREQDRGAESRHAELCDNTKAMSPASARVKQVEGEVTRVKEVSVRDGTHLVASVEGLGGIETLVELGPKDGLRGKEVQKSDRIKASGGTTTIGDKRVVMAQTATIDGRQIEIDRANREIEGTVRGLRTASVRGEEHQFAVLEVEGGKDVLVDLGVKGRLDSRIREGQRATVRGTPVKVRDRRVMMAQSVTTNGRTASIDRGLSEEQRGG